MHSIMNKLKENLTLEELRVAAEELSSGEKVSYCDILKTDIREEIGELGRLSLDEISHLREMLLLKIAREKDDPEGFSAFYEIVTGNKLPEHCYRWIEAIYRAKERDRGIVIQAFRGSTKTTTITILFTAWRIGKEPQKTNLLIQVGDDIAIDNTSQVADIIKNNAGYRRVFPHIEPDFEAGWGAGGYYVKRTDIDYSEWRKVMVGVKDPTLVGVGYKSREIIGKHPGGVLVIDDINDENNTSSKKELRSVLKILQDTILPTEVPGTWRIFVGTPWVEDDVLNYVKATGEYDFMDTPVYEVTDADPNGRDVIELWGQVVRLTWPAVINAEYLRRKRNEIGEIGFSRMYLLDLKRREKALFKYQLYPSEAVRYSWPLVGGVDYAGVGNAYTNITNKNDYFALCYLAKLPGGGAVVIDGVLERCTQAEAEGYILRAQEIYPNWLHTVVESDGRGEELIQVLRRHPSLRIVPHHTRGRAKQDRFMMGISPWLENGMVRISDAETPFLQELRRELDTYPFCEYDDALDALYYAMAGMPDVLRIEVESGDVDAVIAPRGEYGRKRNPFSRLGKLIGGGR